MTIFIQRHYTLIDSEGNRLATEVSQRPSGPMLNNVAYYEGKRWVETSTLPPIE